MANELWAGIPLLILIAGALITKRIMEPALISSVVAVAMLEGGNFVNGYVGKMYEVLSNPSFQLLVFVGLGFAGISALWKSQALCWDSGGLWRRSAAPVRRLFFSPGCWEVLFSLTIISTLLRCRLP